MGPTQQGFSPHGIEIMFLLLLSLVLSRVSAETCATCSSRPPDDCVMGNQAPAEGGPPCSCVEIASLDGCVLKSCSEVRDAGPCDLTPDSQGFENRSLTFKYNCTGDEGACEICTSLPPDCDMHGSFKHPPAKGGPDCACNHYNVPGGCTMKPCSKENSGPAPCICTPGVSSILCFTGPCPGNRLGSGGEGGGGGSGTVGSGLVKKPNHVLLVSIVGVVGQAIWSSSCC